MSELEKVRAVSLLSIIVIALVAMFALQSGQTTLTTHSSALEVCAATKGALCEIVDNPATIAPINAAAANLGAMVVVAPPALGVEPVRQSAATAASATEVAANRGDDGVRPEPAVGPVHGGGRQPRGTRTPHRRQGRSKTAYRGERPQRPVPTERFP